MEIGRRELLASSAAAFAVSLMPQGLSAQPAKRSSTVTLFLCGDVMTGRGIDQILPHPGDPQLYERYVKSALRYVEIAEERNGPIPKPVAPAYIWGDALEALHAADVRIVNLETSITTSDKRFPKAINYRMHPANVSCITAAAIDCCVLANNHALDWDAQGLVETLDVLHRANVKTAGAGRDQREAAQPAACPVGTKHRALVLGVGSTSSGIPRSWEASTNQPGINLLPEDAAYVRDVKRVLEAKRKPGDIAIVSVHWGPNWGYRISKEHRTLAHRLIDEAGADVVHGHSSHHVKGIEVYRDRLILYGCGDFINDYEGIRGHEAYRGDLALAYTVSMSPESLKLQSLKMMPLQMRRFQLNRATERDARWLRDVLRREGRALGTTAELATGNTLTLGWRS